jgi:hypothetical protein
MLKIKGFESIKQKDKVTETLARKRTESFVKKHLEGIYKEIDKGLRGQRFGHKKLRPLTLDIRKASKTEDKKLAPLVGYGGMIKNLEIVKTGKGWVLQPNNKYAVSPENGKKTSWKRIWSIHENGAKISVTQKMKNAFLYWWKIPLKVGSVLKIEPRKTFDKAYRAYIRSAMKDRVNKDIEKELSKLL